MWSYIGIPLYNSDLIAILILWLSHFPTVTNTLYSHKGLVEDLSPVLLLSLYTSILFTLLCAIVPNYTTLLLSRALVGLCVRLNMVHCWYILCRTCIWSGSLRFWDFSDEFCVFSRWWMGCSSGIFPPGFGRMKGIRFVYLSSFFCATYTYSTLLHKGRE